MQDYSYDTLRGLGTALYLHHGLVKRAEEAKLALENIEMIMRSKPFKMVKRIARRVSDAANKVNNSGAAPTQTTSSINIKNDVIKNRRVSSLVQ